MVCRQGVFDTPRRDAVADVLRQVEAVRVGGIRLERHRPCGASEIEVSQRRSIFSPVLARHLSRTIFRTYVWSGSILSRPFHSSAYTSCTQSHASLRLRRRLYASAYIFPHNGKYNCVNCSCVMVCCYFAPLKMPLSVSSLLRRCQPSRCLVPKSRLKLKLSISTWR